MASEKLIVKANFDNGLPNPARDGRKEWCIGDMYEGDDAGELFAKGLLKKAEEKPAEPSVPPAMPSNGGGEPAASGEGDDAGEKKSKPSSKKKG